MSTAIGNHLDTYFATPPFGAIALIYVNLGGQNLSFGAIAPKW
jgi:hypothetical protein